MNGIVFVSWWCDKSSLLKLLGLDARLSSPTVHILPALFMQGLLPAATLPHPQPPKLYAPLILYLHKSHNTPLLPPPPPPKFCIILVCNFFWDTKMSQGKSKTMPMQISFFGGGAVGRSGVWWYCARRVFNKDQFTAHSLSWAWIH